MKFVRFGADQLGVIAGDDVIDISGLVEPAAGGRLHAWIEASGAGAALSPGQLSGLPRLALADLPLTCPLPLPPKIIAAPVNYLDHKAEMEVEHTVADLGIFLKARTSVIGPGETVVLPYTDKRFDQEAELGVVIGSRVRDIAPHDALDAVFGYTCLFDMSMRSTEDRSTRKSFDTFTPIGPYVVTRDEVPDIAALHMTCSVNGTVRQDTSLADLIFDVPTLIAYASSVMTLEPGDIIATGTPAGVGAVADGDSLVMEITGLGRLEVSVSARDAVPYEERPGARLTPRTVGNRLGSSA
ncbi:fumarylacetoacetate hydrolase family protein [Nocardia sp. R7R-8]|uniref:fumarylacetoacetate hydrolase family protein n=1 Tax=Nocardia sp. R7R-8 TaxID=3459304 RepID=UPI00403E222C